jgi:ribosomal RNA-processing protein 12
LLSSWVGCLLLMFQKLISRPATGDAFEDVLYGSESELEDSDTERYSLPPSGASKRKFPENRTRLRVDDDEPMDLLHGVASRTTSIY